MPDVAIISVQTNGRMLTIISIRVVVTCWDHSDKHSADRSRGDQPKGSALFKRPRRRRFFANLPAYVHEAICGYINGAVTNYAREEEMQLYLEPCLGEGQKAFWAKSLR